jgi:hypothetical protein
MKKLLAIFLVFITVFSLASCGENSSIPDGMILLENDKVTYTLCIPETWTVDIADGVSTAYASDKSNISLMTMQWSSASYNSLEEYCANYYKTVKATMQNVSEIEEYKENQYFGALPALKYVYTIGADAKEGEEALPKYKFMQIFSYDTSGQVYIFTYTALEENYDSHTKAVAQIVENFKP